MINSPREHLFRFNKRAALAVVSWHSHCVQDHVSRGTSMPSGAYLSVFPPAQWFVINQIKDTICHQREMVFGGGAHVLPSDQNDSSNRRILNISFQVGTKNTNRLTVVRYKLVFLS